MKFLLVNWAHSNELKGGCETFFSELDRLLKEMGHETKLVSFKSAQKVMGMNIERGSTGFFEAEASHIMDRYCHQYMNLFPKTFIISNAGITNFWYKNPNTINVFNDPYHDIVAKLTKLSFYGATTYNKYGQICVRMQQESAMCAKRNIAVSEFMANEMRKLGIGTDVIEHGVNLEIFRPMDKAELRKKYGIPEGMTVAVWSKDFHPVAGFHILSNLIKKRKDIFWVLNFKTEQKYRPKSKNAKIIQPVEREIMPEIYNLGDFLINPSATESFGLVPLEAMACGIPCILNNTGFVWESGVKDGINKRPYGMLVSEWNEKAYEDAIEMLQGERFSPRSHAEKYGMKRWRKEWSGLIELCTI